MSLAGKTIGFIGAGAMAEALAGGLIAAGVARPRLLAADVDEARRRHLEAALEVRTTADNAELVEHSDVVVLAVKPKVVGPVLEDLCNSKSLDPSRSLWISIAAGVRIAALEAKLSAAARIVRAMPNTPALIRNGATALCGNARAGGEDLAAARSLFDSVGLTWQAPAEELLDAVTGLSGSGPAYVFAFLEALIEAGVAVGLPRDAAAQLAEQTVYGAARLVRESNRSPAELRQQVSSPGGTTLAGLERLEALDFARALREAVAAATQRARELGEAD